MCEQTMRRSIFRATLAFAVAVAPFAIASGQEQQADERLKQCLMRMAEVLPEKRDINVAKGLTRQQFLEATRRVQWQGEALDVQSRAKTERAVIWDTMAAMVDDQREKDGREVMERLKAVLEQVSAQYGVTPASLVGLYGIETDFGRKQGKYPVLDTAVTRACNACPTETTDGCSGARTEAYAAVRVIRRKFAPEGLLGSYAAAFGHTQFVPTTFEELGVDVDKDGRADVIGSAHEALASAARHLKVRGKYQPGLPLLIEVKPERGAKHTWASEPPFLEACPRAIRRKDGKKQHRVILRQCDAARPVEAWRAEKWEAASDFDKKLMDGLAQGTLLYLLRPAGTTGPALLATQNYWAVQAYNPGDPVYPLKIAALARRMVGAPAFATPWPTDDPGLSRAEMYRLQSWLRERENAEIGPDGIY